MKDNLLSIIFTYRDRDALRVKKSLDSLLEQSDQQFNVIFTDYGSCPTYREEISSLCNKYSFVKYIYCHTRFQPWNKGRALNFIIKNLTTDFIFIADVDMIFHPDFVKKAKHLQQKNTTVYFQVGFLDPKEEILQVDFSDKNFRKSTSEATGLSMFPTKPLKELRGFDEFYHFWGAEDTDMHVRLQNAGYKVEFYEKEVLLLHQWHPSYRSREKFGITEQPQISGIVQINQQHLQQAREQKKTIVNSDYWGNCLAQNEVRILEETEFNYSLTTEKKVIDEFFYGQLPEIQNHIVKLKITKSPFDGTLKYKFKKIIAKKVPECYSLKEVNDIILLHLISFYRNKPYLYKVHPNFDHLEIALKL